MGAWIIIRESKGLHGTKVFYDNLYTGVRVPLGTVSSEIEDEVIVKWVYEHGIPAYGDKIYLSDGRSFIYRPKKELPN